MYKLHKLFFPNYRICICVFLFSKLHLMVLFLHLKKMFCVFILFIIFVAAFLSLVLPCKEREMELTKADKLLELKAMERQL